jgi:hypothetical protein
MKEVALLLLLALMLNGCGGSNLITTQTAQSAAAGIWSAQIFGGSGEASGFSFNTEFTVNSSGTLSITYFQFLTTGTCFPVDGGTENGSMDLIINSSTSAVTGTFTYTVQSSSNKLTLNGQVTGTANGTATSLSDGSITGTWTVAGGTGCNATGGTFTMCQSSSSCTATGTPTPTPTPALLRDQSLLQSPSLLQNQSLR